MKQIPLPCNCTIDIDTERFKTGERGVSCDRHERSFVITAVMPTEPDHRITREMPYRKQTVQS